MPVAPSDTKPPTDSAPCAIAQVLPSGPLSGAAISVPPTRLLALPIDDAVTSNDVPGFANAGSSAVSMTAATFFALSSVGSIVNAEPLDHLGQGVLHERRHDVVAAAVEPDDDADAGEVVIAHAGDRRQIFDPIGGCGAAEGERDGDGGERTHQNGQILLSTRPSQPRRWVSLISPRPVYSTSASAMRDDGIVSSSATSIRRTTPLT